MNFTILAVTVIVILGICLRILPYDSVQGLWNDEYVSWYISQKPLLIPFVKGIFEQCHMPLYYLYLKLITYIFGSSDTVLRLSSFVIGALNILVMYFVGNLKSSKHGIVCALFSALSGILIYYSYEVRPYSLIFLFSSLILLFSLKLIEKQNKQNIIFYILSVCGLLFTHTTGFIYAVCSLGFTGYCLRNKKPEYTKNILLSVGIFFLILTPLMINIFTVTSFSQWWSNFSISKVFFMFTDMFSNYLINLVNAPQNFISAITPKFFIFGIIPAVIAVIGLLNVLFLKNLYLKLLSLTAIVPTIILLAVSFSGKIVFLTKYNFEIYPVLIYLFVLGLFELKNKKIRVVVFSILFIINGLFIFTKDFKHYFYKSESNKLAAELLLNANLNPDDIIIFTYYPRERFAKYFDYSLYEVREIHKGNFFYYLTPDTTYNDAVVNAQNIYKKIYLSKNNTHLNNAIESEFYQNIREGKKIAILFLNSVSMLSDVQIFQIANNEKYYKKTPQMYMIFSYVKNFLIKKMNTDLQLIKYEQKGDWSIIIFEKTK